MEEKCVKCQGDTQHMCSGCKAVVPAAEVATHNCPGATVELQCKGCGMAPTAETCTC